jgi:hypothetical protein
MFERMENFRKWCGAVLEFVIFSWGDKRRRSDALLLMIGINFSYEI